MKEREASDREKVTQMIDLSQYKIKTKEQELVTPASSQKR